MTAEILGTPLEFFLFGLTLLGIALFHKRALWVAVGGLAVVVVFKLACGFSLLKHLGHEWRILVNLLGLLVGFAILAKYFEESRIPEKLPAVLPNNWTGGLGLLAIVFVLSAFLDNIAAAMIGGAMARCLFKGKVHIGFLAAVVAASNAGGAGSVVGDTTTTMMWIDGVRATQVLEATVGSAVAFAFFGVVGARQQHRLQPIVREASEGVRIDWLRVLIVVLVLAGAISANVLLGFPAVGVWGAILLGALIRKPAWHEIPGALKGSCFLLSLVLAASLMPVERLPRALWQTTLGLGFLSSVFDNIPLTKLALDQGGYDWGFLAYAVGFGGSMTWFGSSAGVAITIEYPEARSVAKWLRHGWHVPVAYVAGFGAMMLFLGWHPPGPHRSSKDSPPRAASCGRVVSAPPPRSSSSSSLGETYERLLSDRRHQHAPSIPGDAPGENGGRAQEIPAPAAGHSAAPLSLVGVRGTGDAQNRGAAQAGEVPAPDRPDPGARE